MEVLAYPGCVGTVLFGLVDILAFANTLSTVLRPGTGPPFRTRVVSVRQGRIRLAGGFTFEAERASRAGTADQLLVPGCECADPAQLDAVLGGLASEVAFLHRFAGRRSRVASVCAGAFLLAEAGLLDGRTATTSWLYAPQFARRYPRVDLRSTAMVVQDGPVVTAGAFSAYADLALRLVAEHAGEDVAAATARVTLSARSRASQAPFADERLLPVPHARFADDVRAWLHRHLAEPYRLDDLASAFNVSTRTMLRRFAAQTGESPLAYLQRSRVITAKRLLETSELDVQTIRRQVGYRDAATFRRLFVAQIGSTPAEYRRQFRPPT